MDDETRQFIDENFTVNVTHPAMYAYNSDSYGISVTHNGRQYETITLTSTEEVRKLIEALQDAIDGEEKR